MLRSAVLSSCGTHRFQLLREITPGKTVLFVLNNPSTADGQHEDPTSRRGIGYIESWGYSRYYFGNANCWRSTDPKLARVPTEDILEENDEWLRKMAREANITIAAWGGKANPVLAQRALDVLLSVTDVYALELTRDGTPKHILYLKGSLSPFLWRSSLL